MKYSGKSYIKLNLQVKQREKQWCCPICHKRVYYQELFWDDDLQKHLDTYKKQNPALDESSSDPSDSETQPAPKKASEQAVLPKFKLYLHKGKVWTPEEMVRIAPWVLKQGISNIQPPTEAKSAGGAKLSVNAASLSNSVRPDLQSAELSSLKIKRGTCVRQVGSLKYPLNKRQPLEVEEGKLHSGDVVERFESLEPKPTAKKNLGGIQKPLKKEAAKTSVRTERQQSSSSHRIPLAEKLSPKGPQLKGAGSQVEPEPLSQSPIAMIRAPPGKEESSFEFLNESSDEKVIQQPSDAKPAVGVQGVNGTKTISSPAKVGTAERESSGTKTPFRGRRENEDSYESTTGAERRKQAASSKKSVQRSLAKDKTELVSRGKGVEQSVDLGARKAQRLGDSEGRPLGKRSTSLAALKNHAKHRL